MFQPIKTSITLSSHHKSNLPNIHLSKIPKNPKSTYFPSHITKSNSKPKSLLHSRYHTQPPVFAFRATHPKKNRTMASTACFLHHHALSTPAKLVSSQRNVLSLKPNQLICRAQKDASPQEDDSNVTISRRLAMTVLIGAAAVGSKVSPADAAYGEAANVFGKPKQNTEFIPVTGDGFKLQVPSKWNPSKEVEYPGQVLRYEDNSDATSNLSVMISPTDKKSISDFGPPEEFLSQVSYLLGKQAYFGKTDSEGGFDSGVVATANILETATPVIGGKQYYFLSVLTRTADGDEGGKHQLITASVSNGKLYICKAQAGDKRWFKGARKLVESAASSFNIA